MEPEGTSGDLRRPSGQNPSQALPLTVQVNGSNDAEPGLRAALKPMNRRDPGASGEVLVRVIVSPDWVQTMSHQHSDRRLTPAGKTSTTSTHTGGPDGFSRLIEDWKPVSQTWEIEYAAATAEAGDGDGSGRGSRRSRLGTGERDGDGAEDEADGVKLGGGGAGEDGGDGDGGRTAPKVGSAAVGDAHPAAGVSVPLGAAVAAWREAGSGRAGPVRDQAAHTTTDTAAAVATTTVRRLGWPELTRRCLPTSLTLTPPDAQRRSAGALGPAADRPLNLPVRVAAS